MHAAGPPVDEDLSGLRDRLARRLRVDPRVRLAYLFGSQARGGARPDSDLDVAVLLDDDAVGEPSAVKDTLWRLSGALGREVPSDRLDLVVLNDAPPLLRHRVIRDGVLLFSRSEAERVRFVIGALRDQQDVEPRLREHTRRRIQRLKEGQAHGRCGDLLETARRAGRLLAAAPAPRTGE